MKKKRTSERRADLGPDNGKVDEASSEEKWKERTVTDNENENYFFTPVMSAAEWRRILNAMLCILKKRYRQAKAEEKKPKPRKPRRIPFKESMYAAIA